MLKYLLYPFILLFRLVREILLVLLDLFRGPILVILSLFTACLVEGLFILLVWFFKRWVSAEERYLLI